MRPPFDVPLAAWEQQAEGFPGGQITERRMASAPWDDFADWPAREEFANAVAGGGAVFRVESAVEAFLDGDLAILNRLQDEDTALIQTRPLA